MTVDWASGLLRQPNAPRRATFLELFYDLIFVVALALVSQTLVNNFTPSGALHAVVSLMAIWWVWVLTALVTDLYNPQHPALQAMTLVVMLGVSLMATAIPTAFGERAPIFAGAYVAIHLGRGVFFAAALRGDGAARARAMRVWVWFGISSVPWLAGAILPGPARGILWVVALAVDYTALAIRFPVPLWREVPTRDLTPTAEHLAERYHQFFAIALGDILLVAGLAFSRVAISPLRTAAFLSAFASALLLWRLYSHCAGDLLSKAISVSPAPGRFAQSAPYTHLLMVAGVVATGASAKLIIDSPGGTVRWSEVAVVLGGPALFLLGRARFDYEVFGRTSRSLLAGLVALVVLSPATRWLPPLLVAVTANLVLATVVAFDTLSRRRIDQIPPAPPL